jgi:2-oxoisovalerate dehydrogenase E2 component (dihydrolipoyl transacylase)
VSDIRDFKLPDLGEGLEEGEIVEWHVEVGDTIELNQTVADIETAKAVVAVPSPFAGVVVERIGEVGEALEVGSVFVRIDVSEGAVATDVEPEHQGEASPAQGGFEADPAAAEASAPDADASPTAAIADDAGPTDAGRVSTGLDADEEPQPLVGYGQGRSGPARGRRRRGAAGGGETGDGAVADASEPRAPAEVLAKPPVRKLAKDLGVDLAALAPGSGPDGVITRDDVQRASASASGGVASGGASASGPAAIGPAAVSGAEATPAQQPELRGGAGEKAVPGFRGRVPGEVEPIRGIRKRIVEKMELSRREIPEASCSREADLTELWEVRRTLTAMARDEGFDVKISPFSLVMRATVLGLRRFPTLNARIDREAGEIHLLEHINLGFAADTDRGLMVPNIKDAHTKSTLQLALELTELAGQARDGSIGPGPLTGGTFTVNNYGAFGNDDGDPIINHPEAAILGIGAIRQRPWVVPASSGDPDEPGELAVRRVARFTLAFDHRICDGGEAGRFVTYVADLCEQPAKLLLHV